MVGLRRWHAAEGFVDAPQGTFEPDPLLSPKIGTGYFPPSRTSRSIQALKTPGYTMSTSQDGALY